MLCDKNNSTKLLSHHNVNLNIKKKKRTYKKHKKYKNKKGEQDQRKAPLIHQKRKKTGTTMVRFCNPITHRRHNVELEHRKI